MVTLELQYEGWGHFLVTAFKHRGSIWIVRAFVLEGSADRLEDTRNDFYPPGRSHFVIPLEDTQSALLFEARLIVLWGIKGWRPGHV
ncbi:hypothetical protein VNO77_00078 [Canavalia gladiata]|uniref:Uncharacterized protein n=1 Tax=Canavalia gladiata TaxID=3824 RepID=A0AAN9MPE9_CANGL